MIIDEDNISIAWAKAFELVSKAPGKMISPLLVNINILDKKPLEVESIRDYLDYLHSSRPALKDKLVHTVANTIFPNFLWNRNKPPKDLYSQYQKIWPKIKGCRGNSNGVYFERMISFENDLEPINQLQHVIDTWKGGNHRKSALQISIIDPRKDLTNQRQRGFPCLQQIGFVPMGVNGSDGLMLSAYYPTQYIFEKAYGNYLGLYRLGQFMAHYMKLKLRRLCCYIGAAELGRVDASEANRILKNLKKLRY